ncbi:hypothetical protein acdb102_41030 [Acidothermaceae bacterium B102]|nr:hypothetical protein acdb102_41030 [Acidothermaceae bacterium B102]
MNRLPFPLVSAAATAVVCVAVTGCGPTATTASAPGSTTPAAVTSAAPAAVAAVAATTAAPVPAVSSAAAVAPSAVATSASPPAAAGGLGGAGPCALVTDAEATTALGAPAGKGTAQGSATESRCIWADGALAVTVFANGKPEYDQLASRTEITHATDTTWHKLDGLGGDGFVKYGGPLALVFFLHGTTLVNIILSGPGATARPDAAVVVARAAAGRL